ncbi:300 kDa antigen AG231 [Drosophila rhopaloa]|uniref:300 kDa antigen AG231 n=1 Tax=Drosophila rhopaloa TaxID=1041015 RepID=A0A6P4EPK9_DRORH|nr:300 kDa antigen AG231 [Drosophila rhopaloa]
MFKLSMLLGLALVLAPSVIEAKSLCRQSGYFTLVDNTPDFYACQSTGLGGFSMRFLRCPAGLVFSSSSAQCVATSRIEARDDSNIENPTIPPEPVPDAVSTEAPVTTEEPATEAPVTTEKPATDDPATTEKPATDAPATTEAPTTTEQPATEDPVTTEKPATDDPVTTEKPATDDPVTTEKPATDAPVTNEPVTNEPVTDEPVTDEPVTDEPVTDETDEPVTDDRTTEEPVTDPTDVTKTTDDDSATTKEDQNCATTGFFPMDGSCTHFIVCSYGDGDEVNSYPFKCPGDMQFDPFNSICSSKYDCTA